MKSSFSLTLCALLASALMPLHGARAAAPAVAPTPAPTPTQAQPALQVSDFDESSWARLLRSGPRPAAYLFTTSYCSTCPQAFATLQQAVARKGQDVPLAAVMMDVAGSQALRHAVHFPGLTKLYAFDGYEAAIRHSVDPAWPNVTPYVVLIDKQGRVRRFIGPPPASALRNWLG